MGNWTKWTPKMHLFLLKNYKRMGDQEISERLQRLFPKPYGWTNKHIEKRRKHFGLRRTRSEIVAIRERNIKQGRLSNASKMWDVRGRAEQGEMRIYKGKLFMKSGRSFKPYHRELYKNMVGKDPGAIIVTRDFELISRAELARRNRLKSLGYTGEILEAFKQLQELKSLIHGKENSRPA